MFKSKDVNTVLNREDILAVEDIVIQPVDVPEWGGRVFIKGMTGAERDSFESSLVRATSKNKQDPSIDMSNVRAKLCSRTICNEEGKLLFTPSDIKALTKKSAVALQRCWDVARRLSGLSDEDIEELTEELEDSPFEDSAFDQPGIQA